MLWQCADGAGAGGLVGSRGSAPAVRASLSVWRLSAFTFTVFAQLFASFKRGERTSDNSDEKSGLLN